MNIVVWMLAGGMLGWIGYSFLRFNEGRSLVASIFIGAVGGMVGGKLIAPMFSAVAAAPGGFSVTALFFAAAVASAFLVVGSKVHERWGV